MATRETQQTQRTQQTQKQSKQTEAKMAKREATHHTTVHQHPADALVDHEELVDLKEAMAILDRSRMRVRAYIKEDDDEKELNLRTARKIRGKWFIERDEVNELARYLKEKYQANAEQRAQQREARKRRSIERVLGMVRNDPDLDEETQEKFDAYLKQQLEQI